MLVDQILLIVEHMSAKNDLVKLISDTDNTNWIVLDPENDTAGSDGSDGAVQLASGGSLSSDTGLFFKDNALFIGGLEHLMLLYN